MCVSSPRDHLMISAWRVSRLTGRAELCGDVLAPMRDARYGLENLVVGT